MSLPLWRRNRRDAGKAQQPKALWPARRGALGRWWPGLLAVFLVATSASLAVTAGAVGGARGDDGRRGMKSPDYMAAPRERGSLPDGEVGLNRRSLVARSLRDRAGDRTGEALVEVRADALGRPLATDEIAQRYAKPSVLLRQGETVTFTLDVPTTGDYVIAFDMVAVPTEMDAPEGQLRVDGQFPAGDLRRIVFPAFYRNTADRFPKDRYGNDALIRQERLPLWTQAPARDVNMSHPYPLRVPLTAGQRQAAFTVTQGAMYLGSVYLLPPTNYPTYAEYLAAHSAAADAQDVVISLEAEFPAFKNDTAVRPTANRSLKVTPYDTYRLLLNTMGGESWQRSGTAVYYQIEVPADGMYAVTFHALQNTRNNFTVFRRITVDGQVPFAELNAFPFPYAPDWVNVTLGDDEPYRLFLTQGVHVLGIEATDSPYLPAVQTIQQALLDINALALEIKRLTGNQADRFKEWVISDYIPDIEDRLNAIIADLEVDKETLLAVNQGRQGPEVLTYQMAIDNLRFLAAEPDKIPTRMNRFSEGSGSAAQLLGSLLPLLQSQPLALDKVYVHSPDRPPAEVEVPFRRSFSEGMKRFLHSFQRDPYWSTGAAADELEVWVNRPRQYVDLLQLMADERFTPETGIRVKFSIMPDEAKLVLANAAGIQPDVALGVSTHIPYELAIRNALYDLRSFEDFDRFIRIYTPGALLSYIINDS
ncbi:MAG: hypothetical protein RMN53_16270, partial [Anaerolineae bacterium]|nr:hypothetical protein [Anaerolineae bacterium]